MTDSVDVRSLDGAKEVYAAREGGYFPVVLRTGTSAAVAVIRGGAGHIGVEGRLDLVWTTDSGRTWSEPEVVAQSEWDDRNPSIGLARDGTVVLAYHHQGNYDEVGDLRQGNRVDTLLKVSGDSGRTWSDPLDLSYTDLNGRSPYGRMVNVGSTLLMPIYGAEIGRPEAQRASVSYILRSKDSGRTWDDPTMIAPEMNETSLLNLPSGEMLAMLRSEKGPASVYSARSEDGGYSWSEPVGVTGDSEHPADVILLSNGWLLAVYGHRHPPFGVQGMVSTDMGLSWETGHKLVFADDRPGGDCGYPSATVFEDGRLLIIYYSAGDHMHPRQLEGAFAKAVLLDEEMLISELERRGVG
jgi:hypothetical protein